jgi:hypothetical protein
MFPSQHGFETSVSDTRVCGEAGSTYRVPRVPIVHSLCGEEKVLASGSSVCYNAPDLAGGGTLQLMLFFAFVVAVAFGTWFFGYGLSLLRDQS